MHSESIFNRVPGVLLLLLCLSLLLFTACSTKRAAPTPPPGKPGVKTSKPYTVFGKTYYPLASNQGYEEEGVASWYGPKFHGRRTSNGEVYDMEAMTAAHKTLPLNTWVQVTNLKTGQTAKVRVNDRGPFVDGRIIDLSKAAARRLGVIGPGTARVKVVALGFKEPGTGVAGKPAEYRQPASYQKGEFGVQVGAFGNESNAWRLAARLRVDYPPVKLETFDRGDMVFHRVLVGKVTDLEQAKELQRKLRAQGFKNAFARAL